MQRKVGLAYLLIASCVASHAHAQNRLRTFHPSVGMSFSYVYDFNEPRDDLAQFNRRSYANVRGGDETIDVDLFQLALHGERDRVGYGVKIDLGELALRVGDADDGEVALQEAWLAYDLGSFALTAGRFATPLGYEVIEPWGNAHISRSRTWAWIMPVSHDGIDVSTTLGGVDVSVGAINSAYVSDPAANDYNQEPGVVGSLAFSLGDVAITGSALYSDDFNFLNGLGSSDQMISNLILAVPLGSVSAAVEGTWQHDFDEDRDFWNVVAYGGTAVRFLGLDVRAEYGRTDLPSPNLLISERDDVYFWTITTTASFALTDEVDFRIEYRHDDSETDYFAKDDQDFGSHHLNVALAQLVMTPSP